MAMHQIAPHQPLVLFRQVTGMSCRARVSVVQESSFSKCHPFLFALQTEHFLV